MGEADPTVAYPWRRIRFLGTLSGRKEQQLRLNAVLPKNVPFAKDTLPRTHSRCNVLDDVVPVCREEKKHYRRANDKRAKPAALESELLLVVLD